ncbi:hypothetical protein HYS47_00380 [Candidatus Woesearchaeota archaeon]|nr:hypothetical protein [Candidatus Woesearchaeota archaeon]
MVLDPLLTPETDPNIQRYFEKGLAETLERLETAEHNRQAIKAWREEKKKTHRQLCDDAPDDEYPDMLDMMLKMAEADVWYATEHPILYVVPELGISQQTVFSALRGIQYLRDYGVSWSTRIMQKQSLVTAILDHADHGDGLERGGKVDIALELISDECSSHRYRPGIVVLLNRQIEGPNRPLGIVKTPFGAVIAKPDKYTPLDIVVAHELDHYLWLDGRKPFDADMGHCFTEPCMMNIDEPISRLCEHHRNTLYGYHAGIMEAKRR